MIYFLQDTVSQAIKVGYSKNPKNRQEYLQTATANLLILLGTIPGGLEHEAAFHARFAQYRLQGEWFNGEILQEVKRIIAEAASQIEKINVIIAGDSGFTLGPLHQPQNQALVLEALNELHVKTPIAWVVTGGERQIDNLAWRWAQENKVKVHRYFPKWKSHGRFAGFKVGPRLLRSRFDPKLLLVFMVGDGSSSTRSLIKGAEKKGIPVAIKRGT